jgi:hypothetical protein
VTAAKAATTAAKTTVATATTPAMACCHRTGRHRGHAEPSGHSGCNHSPSH